MRNKTHQRVIWLCGASSGIGLELARRLLNEDCRLIVSSRDPARLQSFAGDAYLLKCDVQNSGDWHNCYREIAAKFGRLDTFIYNAGDCEYIDVHNFHSDVFERIVDVNFLGLVRATGSVLPLLRKGNSPHIIGVGSSVDYLPLSRAEAYGASKAAMSYFLESLRVDLAPEKIDVSIVKPGFVKTPLTDKNDFPMPFIISAEEASLRIMKGVRKRSREINFPRRFTWLIRLFGLFPPTLRFFIARRFVKS